MRQIFRRSKQIESRGTIFVDEERTLYREFGPATIHCVDAKTIGQNKYVRVLIAVKCRIVIFCSVCAMLQNVPMILNPSCSLYHTSFCN